MNPEQRGDIDLGEVREERRQHHDHRDDAGKGDDLAPGIAAELAIELRGERQREHEGDRRRDPQGTKDDGGQLAVQQQQAHEADRRGDHGDGQQPQAEPDDTERPAAQVVHLGWPEPDLLVARRHRDVAAGPAQPLFPQRADESGLLRKHHCEWFEHDLPAAQLGLEGSDRVFGEG